MMTTSMVSLWWYSAVWWMFHWRRIWTFLHGQEDKNLTQSSTITSIRRQDKGNSSYGTPWKAAISAQKCAPTQGVEQKSLRISAEVARAGAEILFLAYVQSLGNGISFKYLRRLLSATYKDCPEFMAKLKKERNNHAHILRLKDGRNMLQNFHPIRPPLWSRDTGCDPPPPPSTGGIQWMGLPIDNW